MNPKYFSLPEEKRSAILIGQSMGGYVSQCFMQQYPGETAGFISIHQGICRNPFRRNSHE